MVTTRNMMRNDKHTPRETKNHPQDLMAIITEIRRKLEKLKKKNTEEINNMKRKNEEGI